MTAPERSKLDQAERKAQQATEALARTARELQGLVELVEKQGQQLEVLSGRVSAILHHLNQE